MATCVKITWASKAYPKPDLKKVRHFAEAAIHAAKLEMNGQILPITFLDSKPMAEINMEHLGHVGDTDVITFDYRSDFPFSDDEPGEPIGELFICPAVAERQAKGRTFRNYSRELSLYMVHGILHLCGEDDLTPKPRARMRRQENRVMRALAELDPDTLFQA